MQPPEAISCLVDVAGEDAVLCLLEAEGGKQMSVPRKSVGSRIAALYGEDLARVICDLFGPGVWVVPMCKRWRIVRYREMGLTIMEIATRVGLSERAVYRAIHSARADGARVRRPPRPVDPRQPSLF